MNQKKSTVLVPFSFSPHSKTTFDVGFELAKRFELGLILLHVIQDPFGTETFQFPYVYVKEEEWEKHREEVTEELHKLAEQKKDSGVSIKEMVFEGEATQKIPELIDEENVFTLVLGHHSTGWFNHLLLGHDTIRLAERAPCNVMLVHHSNEDLPV